MTIVPLRLRAAARRFVLTTLSLCAMLAAFGAPGAAFAAVQLRVEARPASDPIQAFVRVTDANGAPIAGLTAGDFTVTIDGNPVAIGGVTQPPAQSNQKVSVIFVMDYSQSVQAVALADMQQAILDFVANMEDGDFAAIVKFNETNPASASVVLQFTEINHGGGSDAVFENAVSAPYDGDGTNLLDALEVAVNHFLSPPVLLPEGPKAIILVSDGGENESTISESEVIALANANSIPVFTVGVGTLTNRGVNLMTELGTETGGEFFEAASPEEIAEAYATISELLTQEYLISIPDGTTDCAEHTLVVTVAGPPPETATASFTRRVCDTEPDPFSFTSQADVARSTDVTSNTETITGLEVPAHISVINGTYSIGCNGTFTGDPATIANGETVCVRHVAAGGFSTSKTSTLTVGGVAATFTSTTLADSSGGGGGSGGGGATGLFELLLGLGALLLARRRLV